MEAVRINIAGLSGYEVAIKISRAVEALGPHAVVDVTPEVVTVKRVPIRVGSDDGDLDCLCPKPCC